MKRIYYSLLIICAMPLTIPFAIILIAISNAKSILGKIIESSEELKREQERDEMMRLHKNFFKKY